MKYENILDTIGNTPLVRLNKLNIPSGVKIYAKLEGQNPAGSVKDRIALSMIESAEESGELKKDKIILEPTSGNTGLGLAMVAKVKGYRLILTMSAGMSEERKKLLRALGAELIETNPDFGTDGAIIKAKEIFDNNKHWMPYQFDNENNLLAHYYGTAEEIIKDIPEITAFVAGMGTSGTLMGVSKRLKEYNSKIQIIAAEPQEKHKIQGLKNMKEAIVPKIYDIRRIDEIITVQNEDANSTARQVIRNEGILVGMSSGASVWAAIKYANTIEKGNIVVIIPDRSEKYVSTVLFE